MPRAYVAAQVITIGRSEHPEWDPEEIYASHVREQAWWSSADHQARLFNNQMVFVRFVPGSELIGRAHVVEHQPELDPSPPEPDLIYRYRFAFDAQVIRTGQSLSDLLDPGAGDRRRRLRVGLVGLTASERTAVAEVMGAATR